MKLKTVSKMDEDLIVSEIINSLAFEIEAVNQDNVLKWTTTNGTPLNVKVRVRNKDEPRLIQRGTLPVPRIGITAPEKLKLISSDQTILSFNVYLEDDLVKQEESKRRNGFKMFSLGGCLGTYSDDEGPYLPGSSKKNALGSKSSSKSDSGILNEKVAHIIGASNSVTRNQKGLFGKCKRGGCLDPPFGEEKYPYDLSKTNHKDKIDLGICELQEKQIHKPGGCLDPPFSEEKYPYTHIKPIPPENLQLSQVNDSNLAHSISIRSLDSKSPNNLNKKSSEIKTSVQKTKNEIEAKILRDIYARTSKENSLVSRYSNSIITYPTDASSTETIYGQIPIKKKSVKSDDEESQRQSYNYPQSYFVPPKNVLRYKEEESKYSRELSDEGIRKKSKISTSDTTDNIAPSETKIVRQKFIPHIAKGSKNNDEIKLNLTEIHPYDMGANQNLYKEKQDSNALPLYLLPNTRTDLIKKVISKSSISNNNFNGQLVGSLRNTNNSTETVDTNKSQVKGPHEQSPDSLIFAQARDFDVTKIEHKDNTLLNPTNLSEQQNQTFKYSTQTADTAIIQKEPKIEGKSSHMKILNLLHGNDYTKVTRTHQIKGEELSSILPQKDLEICNQNKNGEPKEMSTTQLTVLPKSSKTLDKPLISITKLTQQEVDKPILTTSNKIITLLSQQSSKLDDNIDIEKDGELRDDIASLYEIYTEFNSETVHNFKGIQKEHRHLSPGHISSTENIEFDISSTHSMDSRQECLYDGNITNRLSALRHEEQYISKANLATTNRDSVIIQKDIMRDKNIKITSDSENKITHAVLQKAPFTTRHDSDIHNEEVNKIMPLRRNTFTIIGSHTSLQKQEEDEEITENIPDVHLQSADEAKLDTRGHNYEKLHILDTNEENRDIKINTKSGETSRAQENVYDINSTITNKSISKVTPDVINQTRRNVRSTSTSENTSSNPTEVSVKQIPESMSYSEENFLHKSISINGEILSSKIPDKSILNVESYDVKKIADVSNREWEAMKKKDATDAASPISPVIQEIICDSKELLNQQKIAPLHTNGKEVRIVANSDTNLEEHFQMAKKYVNTEIDHNSDVISSSPIQDKINSNSDISEKPLPKNTLFLDQKLTDDDKSVFHTKNRDKIENLVIGSEQEKAMHVDSYLEPSLRYKPEDLIHFYPIVYEKDNSFPLEPTNDKTDSSYSRSNESENNVKSFEVNSTQKPTSVNLHSQMTGDNKSDFITQKCDDDNYMNTDDRESDNVAQYKSARASFLKPGTDSQKSNNSSNIILVETVRDTERLFNFFDEIKYDAPQQVVPKNKADSSPEITENIKYDLSSYQKQIKPDTFNELLKKQENITNRDIDLDTSQKLPIKEGQYIKITEDSSISNGIEVLDTTYYEPESQEYNSSDTNDTQKPQMSDETNNMSEPVISIHNDTYDITGESAIDSSLKVTPGNENDSLFDATQISDDGKFVSSGKTFVGKCTLGEDGNKSQSKIDIASGTDFMSGSKYMDIISDAPKFERSGLDLRGHDSYSIKHENPTIEESSFNTNNTIKDNTANETDVKCYSPIVAQNLIYDSTETKERDRGKSEVLSHISENLEVEERIPGHSRYKDPIGKDIFTGSHSETNRVSETIDSEPPGIETDWDSTMTIISVGNSNVDNKFSKGNYIVPKNTLVNTSMSALKMETDKDSNIETITEAFESMKYTHSFDQISQHTDVVNVPDTTGSKSTGTPPYVVEILVENDMLKKLPAQENDLIELDKENFSQKASNISHNKPFVISQQPASTTQKKLILPNQQLLQETQNRTQPNVTGKQFLRTEITPHEIDKSPLYLDMSFYSYINNNNQRIIQTRKPLIEQERHDDSTTTVIKALIRHGNQLRIPIDKENDLTLNILEKADVIKKDPLSKSLTSDMRQEKCKVRDTLKRNVVLNENLALIYESELVPLHNAIKDLTQEVNTLAVKREGVQEKKRNVKRAKSLRLIPVKRCGCKRV